MIEGLCICGKLSQQEILDKILGIKKSPIHMDEGFCIKRIRRRPTLPPSRPGSTIGAEELNYRDRNGNGCDLLAIATENLYQDFG